MLNGFQAGRTVYSGGSFAPNKGPVSASGSMGYVRRNLAQRARQGNMQRMNGRFNGSEGRPMGAMRVGNDGQSDTRSGLAQAALNRNNPMASHANPNHNQSQQIKGGKPHGGRAPKPGAGNGGGGGTPVPHVTINANGQMELPYDSNYNSTVMSNLGNFNDQLMQLQIGSQQQAAQYQQAMRDENLAYNQQGIHDLSSNAGAGMAYSSKYATDVGHTADTHQNNINSLTSGNDQYNQQVAAQKAAIQDNFNAQLQAAAAQRAKTAAANAGNLGYGKGHIPSPKGNPYKGHGNKGGKGGNNHKGNHKGNHKPAHNQHRRKK